MGRCRRSTSHSSANDRSPALGKLGDAVASHSHSHAGRAVRLHAKRRTRPSGPTSRCDNQHKYQPSNGCSRPSGPTSSCSDRLGITYLGGLRPSGPTNNQASYRECIESANRLAHFQSDTMAIKRKGPNPCSHHVSILGPEAHSCTHIKPIALRMLDRIPALRRRIGTANPS